MSQKQKDIAGLIVGIRNDLLKAEDRLNIIADCIASDFPKTAETLREIAGVICGECSTLEIEPGQPLD